MSKVGILNIFIGFVVVVLASCGGFFLVTDAEKAFLYDKEFLLSWQYTLFKSAHGHFNLFGILHILMGLSLPYSKLNKSRHIYQTVGLFVGTLTMGVLLILRGFLGVSKGLDGLGVVIGINLSLALIALITHCYGLGKKLTKSF